jgi:hypothetical protein
VGANPGGTSGPIESITSGPRHSPRKRILALFDALAGITGPDGFRGCPFLMTLAEYPDPGSAAHARAQAVKAWVRSRLRELTDQLIPSAAAADRAALADQLALVVEGLYASTAALGTEGPARQAGRLATLVIDAALEPARADRGAPARAARRTERH